MEKTKDIYLDITEEKTSDILINNTTNIFKDFKDISTETTKNVKIYLIEDFFIDRTKDIIKDITTEMIIDKISYTTIIIETTKLYFKDNYINISSRFNTTNNIMIYYIIR